MSTECLKDGSFGETYCAGNPRFDGNLTLSLNVDGDLAFGDITISPLPRIPIKNGKVTNGHLSLAGETSFSRQIDVGYESWDSMLSGPTGMVGDLVLRFFPATGSNGSARYKMTLVDVTRQ